MKLDHIRLSFCLLMSGFAILSCNSGTNTLKALPMTHSSNLASKMRGSFTGSWMASNGDSGHISLTIDSSGTVLGEESETGFSVVGRVSGSIDQSGLFRGTCSYPDVPVDELEGTAEFQRDELVIRVDYHHPDNTVRQTYRLRREN